MICKECPLNLTCMAGRLGLNYDVMGLCPECGRLFLTKPDEVPEPPPETKTTDSAFNRVFLGELLPSPKDRMLALRCEKRLTTRKDRARWRELRDARTAHVHEHARRGWIRRDPFDGLTLVVRPCPECYSWGDGHQYFIIDLDENQGYEAEHRDVPAFRLRDRR